MVSTEASIEQMPTGLEHKASFTPFLPGKQQQVQSDVFIEQDKEILSFEGFNAPWWKTLFFYLVAVFSLGISLLVCKWSSKTYISLRLTACKLADALFVRITLMDGRVDLEKISRVVVSSQLDGEQATVGKASDGSEGLLHSQNNQVHRLLEYRCQRYFYVDYISTFVPVPEIPKERTSSQLTVLFVLVTEDKERLNLLKAGDYFHLAKFNPFRADFNDQLQKTASQLSVVGAPQQLDAYWNVEERQMSTYASRYCVDGCGRGVTDSECAEPEVCILLITAFSIISEAVEAHQNLKRMSELAYYSMELEVLRHGKFSTLPSTKLVPGDIVLLDSYVLPCDLVLLRGECIVDENMLTGESVPVRKVPYSPVAEGLGYSPEKLSSCTHQCFPKSHIADRLLSAGESVPVRKVPYSPVAEGLGYSPEKLSSCTHQCFPKSHIADRLLSAGESVPVRKVPYSPVAEGLGYSPEKHPSCTHQCFPKSQIADRLLSAGESVPVRKVPYSPVAEGLGYSPEKHPSCTLYSGTSIAQARGSPGCKAVGMVCRSGFYSAKGQLLRSILYPKEMEATFIKDSLIFIAFMLVLCIGLFIWAAIALAAVGADPWRIGLRFLDMITIAVPPALPACLTIATVFSIGRLRKKGVFVTGPDRITMAGQLDVVCFDKTGTLTEQGLGLEGVVPVNNGQLLQMEKEAGRLAPIMLQLMASCHGLALLGKDLVGDPLDQTLESEPVIVRPAAEIEMSAVALGGVPSGMHKIASTGGLLAAGHKDVRTYVRPPGSVHSYGIVKRFEFSAALQRMLVVVQSPDGSTNVFAKGSPEMIRSMVVPESVPEGFDAMLATFTREGLRVLALAQGDASQVPPGIFAGWNQEETEMQTQLHLVGLAAMVPPGMLAGWNQEETEMQTQLHLVGLAVMVNPLKPCSAGVIKQLQDAGIRTPMVTGDHVRTAISIAHHCGITPESKDICLIDGSDTSSNDPLFLPIISSEETP
eukprot:gene17929-24323_t